MNDVKKDKLKNLYKNKKGSAVVEATLIIPFFLFAMTAIYSMCRCKLAEGVIYEAAYETAEYMAEYSYISEPDYFIPGIMMSKYIDNKSLVEKSIEGGITGINYIGTEVRDSNDYVVLKVNYTLNVSVPFFSKLSKSRQIVIRQRAYIGEGENNGKSECGDDERYVFITDNRDVYHDSNSCTYLRPSIHTTAYASAIKDGYSACEFCGDNCGSIVFVTDEGGRYHSSKSCSRLKRNIHRVKLSDVSDLPGCSRCTK